MSAMLSHCLFFSCSMMSCISGSMVASGVERSGESDAVVEEERDRPAHDDDTPTEREDEATCDDEATERTTRDTDGARARRRRDIATGAREGTSGGE